MATRTKEDFEKLEGEIKFLKNQLGDFKKKAERCDKAEEGSLQLIEEVENLKKANKQLGKSGTVVSGSDPFFDINHSVKIGEGAPKLLFTTRFSNKDYDMHYSYYGPGKDTPTAYVVKYRDSKFHGSQLA